MKKALFALLFLLLTSSPALAEKKGKICLYPKKGGGVSQVNSLDDVPYELRKVARCFDAKQSSYLAKPKDVNLGRSPARVEEISDPMGNKMFIKWPRSVERLFGRTPLRAVTDAANTMSRAIRTAAFPSEVQNLKVDWQIVFMDENVPSAQIPFNLVSNCHPGWMTPPANIYIVGQRVAAGCGGQRNPSASVADAKLTEVLIHEMGHVVEYYIMRGAPRGPTNRMRAEGFATWFEMHAADYSSIVSPSQIKRRTTTLALQAMNYSPQVFAFSGSAADYSRASMYFAAIERRRGIRGIMRVYDRMKRDQVYFFPAVEKEIYWKREDLEKEALKAAESYR